MPYVRNTKEAPVEVGFRLLRNGCHLVVVGKISKEEPCKAEAQTWEKGKLWLLLVHLRVCDQAGSKNAKEITTTSRTKARMMLTVTESNQDGTSPFSIFLPDSLLLVPRLAELIASASYSRVQSKQLVRRYLASLPRGRNHCQVWSLMLAN